MRNTVYQAIITNVTTVRILEVMSDNKTFSGFQSCHLVSSPTA
jgi:hypothetical protein